MLLQILHLEGQFLLESGCLSFSQFELKLKFLLCLLSLTQLSSESFDSLLESLSP